MEEGEIYGYELQENGTIRRYRLEPDTSVRKRFRSRQEQGVPDGGEDAPQFTRAAKRPEAQGPVTEVPEEWEAIHSSRDRRGSADRSKVKIGSGDQNPQWIRRMRTSRRLRAPGALGRRSMRRGIAPFSTSNKGDSASSTFILHPGVGA